MELCCNEVIADFLMPCLNDCIARLAAPFVVGWNGGFRMCHMPFGCMKIAIPLMQMEGHCQK